jgi:GTP-binding protein
MQEPFEELVIDCEDAAPGRGDGRLGQRRAELKNMVPDGKGRVRLEFMIPARGSDRLPTEFLTLTSGSGTMTTSSTITDRSRRRHRHRSNGVLVSMVNGKTLAYALFNLQDRGRLFVARTIEVYEGQIVGLHSRGNDLVVNPTKAKQLTNIRAAGTDEAPPDAAREAHAGAGAGVHRGRRAGRGHPESIRLRKKLLKEHERKRASRAASAD